MSGVRHSELDQPRLLAGIDLSGPANHRDTAFAWFLCDEHGLTYKDVFTDVSDEGVVAHVGRMAKRATVIVGIDAPLSYNDGGGDRPGDASLRSRLKANGLPTQMVMAPTATRMAYLTLRGVGLSRALMLLSGQLEVVEVHPGASLALRGAPAEALEVYKSDDVASCRQLGTWLRDQGLHDLPVLEGPSHIVDACASALAAWHWKAGEPVWLHRAEPPGHPFDFAC